MQKEFEEDFLVSKPSHYEYIRRLQQWRDKYEKLLDSRPRIQPLALVSHYLTEFQYNKIDEIEVPGQYTEVGALNFDQTDTLANTLIGKRYKSELRKDPEICLKVRTRSLKWDLLEEIHSSR